MGDRGVGARRLRAHTGERAQLLRRRRERRSEVMNTTLKTNHPLGAVQRWIQLNDEATARIMKREEHIEWPRKLFAGGGRRVGGPRPGRP